MPGPPEPLSGLNFSYFDPQNFAVPAAGPPGPAGEAPWSARRADVRFPVITLHDDPGGGTAGQVQDALSAIVPFLEEVTGLRYYPPATYLVDEAIVTGLRPAAEPDTRGAPAGETPGDEWPELPAEQDVLIEDLDRLLRTFHDHGNREIKRWDEDVQHVREQAEEEFRAERPPVPGRPGPPGGPGFRQRARRPGPSGFPGLRPRVHPSSCSPSSRRISGPPASIACLTRSRQFFELRHPGVHADEVLRSLAQPVHDAHPGQRSLPR